MSMLHARSRARRKTLVVTMLPAVLLGSLLTAAPAQALGTSLTVTQLEWSLNGLDSNDVTSGPNQFTTGATVCNTTGVAVAGVTATWVWDQVNANINLDSPALKTIGTLAANTCKKLWWTTEITRTTAAWNTSRDFHIEATAPTETTVQTTAGREIYVDKIQSQARNGTAAVNGLVGPTTVYVGDTVTYTMNGFTATGGYSTLEAGPIVDGTILDIQSVTSTYVKPTNPTTRSVYFADGCAWDANPASAGYRTCSLANNLQTNYGGDPIVVTVTAKVIAAGTGKVTALILDASGNSSHYNASPISLNVTAYAVNSPVANDDSGSVVIGSNVAINVPTNDTDADGDLALTSVTITGAASHGTTSVNATTGVVTYTPTSSSYVGTDTFTYQICDSGNRCDTALVTVTIVGPPDAVNDSATVVVGSNVAINVPSNDTDPDGDLALTSVTITGAASHGTTSVNATTGVVTYTPTSPTYVGTDTFNYQICDSGARCDTATVTVTIVAGPTAVADSATVVVGSSVNINVPSNDSDPDGDLALTSVTITGAASHGTTSVNATTGVVTYTPTSPTYVGTDTFTYRICDSGARCTTALVTVTIVAPPVANPDSATVVTGSFVAINVPSNDTDLDGDLALTSVTITGAASHGSTAVNPSTGVVTYTPTNSTYVGTDNFTYRICDSGARCATALVTVTIVAPPVANPDSATVVTGSSVTINVPSNDTDLDGDLALTSVTITGAASHGSTSVNPVTGVVTYTPTNSTYVGTDTFTYQICDSGARCSSALVTVTIVAPPVANDDAATVVVGSFVAINVPSNDTDLDGDLALTTVSITGAASHGSTSVNSSTGVVTYTPSSPTYVGTDTFTYQICDSGSRCDTALVTVTIVAGPTAVADSATVVVGSSVNINVPSNDSDPDGDLALTSVSITGAASHGSTSVNPTTGVVTYTPTSPSYVGTDTFTYQICDSGSRCTTALVTVTIVAPPVANDDSATVVVGSNVAINVPSNDTDLDGDIDLTTVTITGAAAHGTTSVNPTTGVVTYTPTSPTYVGSDTFTYQVCDGGARCDTALVTVTIVAPPVANDDSATVVVGSNVAINVPSNDTDLDGDLALTSVTITGAATHGTTSINSTTGVITYTPTSPTYVGTDTFTYQICDSGNRCDTAVVTVTIVAPPVAVDDSATVVVGSNVAINVPSNDTDLDGDLALTSVTISAAATHGTTSINPTTGVITYTPTSPTYVGTDLFQYQICDGGGRCDTATVTVTIVAPPVAVDDSATVVVGSNVAINVPSNDSDLDGDLALTSVTITGAASHGSTSVNPTTGVVTYTPSSPTYVGTDTFTYQICDSGSRCDTAVVTVTIVAPPVAVDDSEATLTGVPVTVDVPANDTDLDGDLDLTSVSIVGGAANGSVSVDPVTGEIEYTSDPGFVGTDTFSYEICDSGSRCDTAIVTITVTAPPVAVDDVSSTLINTPVDINVVVNDSDLDGDLDLNTVSVTSSPSNGSITFLVGGVFTYEPDFGFSGVDTFDYEICDTEGLCDTATVTITVTAYTGPIAVDDSASGFANTDLVIDVPFNDSDPDGNLDTTTVTIVTSPSNGSVSVDAVTGEVTYTPDLDFVGTDTFEYEICDEDAQCDIALVTVTITAPPVAVDDSGATLTGVPVTVDVPANDTDLDGDLDFTSVTIVSAPANGSVTVDPITGEIEYTSDPGFVGTDTFTYKICDLDGNCDEADVTITVTAPPVAVDDSTDTLTGVPVTVDVPANDSDLDGDLDPTSVSIVSGPSNGSVSVDPVTGEIEYTSTVGFVGTDTFTYEICDLDGNCDQATVTVTVTAPPVAVDDSSDTLTGVPVTVDVPANDSDLDGDLDPTSVSIVSGPSNGSVTVNPVTGVIEYTSTVGFVGTDTFTYEICDLDGNCDQATVTVTVTAPPVAVDDSTDTLTGVPVVIDVPANDSDLDGDLDLSSVSIVTPPSHGSVTVDPITGEIEYTSTVGYVGTDTFTYEICDLAGNCDQADVLITITAPPVANDDSGNTLTGVPVTVDVPANDSDLDGDLDPTSVSIVSGPSHGSVLIDAVTGEIEYTSTVGYVGTDVFSYEICDDAGNCDQADVTITITAPPVAVDDSGSTLSAVPVTINVPSNDSDLDGDLDVTTVSIVTGPANGGVSVNATTGAITYTSGAGFVGTATFTYQICDSAANCDQAVVTITVSAPPAPPVAGDDSVVATTAVPKLINVPLNDSDVDGDLDVTSVTITVDPTNGSASVDPLTGKITYTSDPAFVGVDTLTYEICDSGSRCDTAVVTITVSAVPPVPSPPVAVDDSAATTSGVPVLINVPLNDSDVDGDLNVTSVSVTVPAANGTASVNSVTGRVTYTPDVTFVGTDTFTYQICDLQPVCDTAVVTITVTAPVIPPAPPVATDNSVKTKIGTPVTINVLGNDSDPDGDLDPSSVKIITPPAHGTASIDPDTFEIIYTPDPGFHGVDTLVYEVCDNQPVCTTATVTITVPQLDTLAFTGVQPEKPLLAAFAALLLGMLAMVFAARRRREASE